MGSMLSPRGKREPTATEELNPVLQAIERRIESGEADIDFDTAPDLVEECLAGAAKELQYPHTFNGGDTMKLLHRLLRVVRSPARFCGTVAAMRR